MPSRSLRRACADVTCRVTFTAATPDQRYCPSHQVARDQAEDLARRARRPRASYAEEQRRRAAVEAHVVIYGWWCPGWGTDHQPHASLDLTAHHVEAFGRTGSEGGPLAVLCRSYNSTLGDR